MTLDGANFTGEGLFVFRIEDSDGTLLWASSDLPLPGTTNDPKAILHLMVQDGLYTVRLGDTSSGMQVLDAARLHAARNPTLRIWFSDGKRGWLPVAGETRLKSHVVASPSETSVASVPREDSVAATVQEPQENGQSLPPSQGQAITRPQVAPALTTSKIVTIPLGDTSPSLGRDDAPLVLVEFIDFQCPYCKQAYEHAWPELNRKYVQTGKLRIISRSLALWFHPNAEAAAQAACCAQQQRQFWPMRDWLFANNTTNFLRAARDLNLDPVVFTQCLNSKSNSAQLARDKQDAQTAGITATPSFVIGRPVAGKVTGPLLVGARPLADFDAEIAYILDSPTPQPIGISSNGPQSHVKSTIGN